MIRGSCIKKLEIEPTCNIYLNFLEWAEYTVNAVYLLLE